MGHCVDLQTLMGLPEYVRCPLCKEMTKSWFDEYDIDCGSPQAKHGVMRLDIQCGHCDNTEIQFCVTISYNKERKQ